MSNMRFTKSSFWSLLSNGDIQNITIPIIQRAYTQGGRGDDKKIEVKGDRFLKRLIVALTDKRKPITLDFIYGANINNTIYPLDGQQRLTTLFLLHWYIAQKEGKLSNDIQDKLKKFTYQTRQSSRYFCEHLCEYKVDKKNDGLSGAIKNQKWFMLSWENDPSICSMLQMLDKIDASLKEQSDKFWEILTNSNVSECPITFFYTSLEKLNLTDDLYVKMNARGLELTDFEKFKAPFIRKIDDEGWDNEKIITEKFAHKIDTDWTDLFWKYKEKVEKLDDNRVPYVEYKIDKQLINFIAGIAINCYAQNLEIAEDKDAEEKTRKELMEKEKGKTVTDEAVKRERIEKRITLLANNSTDVNHKDFPTKNSFEYLTNCLNKYSENDNSRITANIPLWGYCDTTFFEDLVLGQNINQQKRVLFYAQTAYLLKNSASNQTEFNEWMRVIRNIIENAISGNWNVTLMVNLIQLITELAGHSNDIYTYLADSATKLLSATAREQVKEEIEKAKIILANSNAKQAIHETEDTNFCKGKIDFALYCVDYDIEAPNHSMFDDTKVSGLKNINKVLSQYLSKDDVSNDFRLAFFTIQNNDFYKKYWSSGMWYGQFERYCLLANTNDFKNCFSLRGRNNDNINKGYWAYSKELLILLAKKSSIKIIEDFKNSPKFNQVDPWIQKLINNPKLLDDSYQHYVVRNLETGKWYLIKWNTYVISDNWDGLQEII